MGRGRDERGKEGRVRERGTGTERGRVWEGRGLGQPPKLKLGPQNYFPGAGAVLTAGLL